VDRSYDLFEMLPDGSALFGRVWSSVTTMRFSDLDRVQRGQKPLDSGSMAPALPGVFELKDEDADFWYRLFYTQLGSKIYVLDCIKKKSNQTSQADIDRSQLRMKAIKKEIAEQVREAKHGKKK
jgi:phage-related protein